MNDQQFFFSGQIQTSQPGGRPYSDTSPNKVGVLWYTSVTRVGKISPLWQKFRSIRQIFDSLFLIWQIRDIIGLIFIVANGQMLKNNLTIW